MNPSVEWLFVAPALMLLALGVLPARWTRRRPRAMRRAALQLAALQFGGAIVGLGLWAWGVAVGAESAIASSWLVSWDGAAALMGALVSGLGWVVCRYSQRYLADEPEEGPYYARFSFTLGSVALMVLAGNFLWLCLAWCGASWGLHHLLTHYRDRPGAQVGAWMKFGVSRLGDALLLVALLLMHREFGTWDFAEVFAALDQRLAVGASLGLTPGIAWLLVLGAAVKTVQFPCHFWLPETMEAPTPVSALMHAGIVNAGGYVMIRTSPLLVQAPEALWTLAAIGAVTAITGGVAMLAQTSVKKSLAYSTIAQMGFMMLQCGLGAFSAALLHILAHSLYKAHAFLASGEALNVARGTAPVAELARQRLGGWQWAAAVGLAGACYVGAMALCGIAPAAKPGGYLLGGLLCLGLIKRLAHVLRIGDAEASLFGAATTFGLCLTYGLAFRTIDALAGSELPALPSSGATLALAAVVGAVFGGLLALESAWAGRRGAKWLQTLYVHAANGFYVDALALRAARAVRE